MRSSPSLSLGSRHPLRRLRCVRAAPLRLVASRRSRSPGGHQEPPARRTPEVCSRTAPGLSGDGCTDLSPCRLHTPGRRAGDRRLDFRRGRRRGSCLLPRRPTNASGGIPRMCLGRGGPPARSPAPRRAPADALGDPVDAAPGRLDDAFEVRQRPAHTVAVRAVAPAGEPLLQFSGGNTNWTARASRIDWTYRSCLRRVPRGEGA